MSRTDAIYIGLFLVGCAMLGYSLNGWYGVIGTVGCGLLGIVSGRWLGSLFGNAYVIIDS